MKKRGKNKQEEEKTKGGGKGGGEGEGRGGGGDHPGSTSRLESHSIQDPDVPRKDSGSWLDSGARWFKGVEPGSIITKNNLNPVCHG